MAPAHFSAAAMVLAIATDESVRLSGCAPKSRTSNVRLVPHDDLNCPVATPRVSGHGPKSLHAAAVNKTAIMLDIRVVFLFLTSERLEPTQHAQVAQGITRG